ncbi:MAG: hypothetical protein KGL39_28940 [Patescibacteria group bacterium]|nr:hypothetical protein [Patescibacteria group bacterium]
MPAPEPPPEEEDLSSAWDGAKSGRSLSRSDIKLLRQAIRGRWPIPDAVRLAIMKRVTGIALTSQEERNVIGAAEVLCNADRINLDEVKVALQADKFDWERSQKSKIDYLEGLLRAAGLLPTDGIPGTASAPGRDDSGSAGVPTNPGDGPRLLPGPGGVSAGGTEG